MKRFLEVLGSRTLVLDGVFGSLLQQRVAGEVLPVEMNLKAPDVIREIYGEYVKAGADIISTNTFGASPLKLADFRLQDQYEVINRAAVKLAREAVGDSGKFVAGVISPSGKLMEPMGEKTFNEIAADFAAQARVLAEAGADLILVETITDIQEIRAAAVGIMEAVTIPIMLSMSFTNHLHSLSGTDGRTFAVTGGFPGLAALGANCGTSLENTRDVMAQINELSHLPTVCQPNAGLPVVENGKPVFKIKPAEFAVFMEEIHVQGTAVLGSCCGSSPEFTARLAERFRNRPVVKRDVKKELRVSSRSMVKEVTGRKIFVIGERINPTGRKKLRSQLEAGDLTTLRRDAVVQEKDGADALDVNVNVHNLKPEILRNIILTLQNTVSVPLVIDSMDKGIIETFARLYAGKGIINSISGEKERMDMLLPVAAKYNMAFIAVLIDEAGISDNWEHRLEIAEKIMTETQKYGIPVENIIFDPLVLSAGAEVEKVAVTLDTISALKSKYPANRVVMGLSNVSFGLPNRGLVNAVFLAMGASRGADLVLANPGNERIAEQLLAIDFLRSGSKENLARYTAHFADFNPRSDGENPGKAQPADTLYHSIIGGDGEGARRHIVPLLEREAPPAVIDAHVVPAMNEVGRRYAAKECFLPQLMAAADAVKAVLPLIKEKLPKNEDGTDAQGTKILFASVKGDVHDIGKNVVIGILESFNFTVIDLGIDVPVEVIVSEAVKHKVDVIGLSALMTTTMPAMFDTVNAVKATEALKDVAIFIGGAVIDESIAAEIGVQYAPDGMEMAKKLR